MATRAIDGGAIPGRKLPSENAPACIGMGETSFFCNQRFHKRAWRMAIDEPSLVVEPLQRGELFLPSEPRVSYR